jgi:nicotinate-nucleotide adenylyltransferase
MECLGVNMRRIGIMGGTFNPIHMAHLILAEGAYEQLQLDEVIFMPSKTPPHKLGEVIAENSHRVHMIKLAIQDNPHFRLSTMELEREGITYTVDTLRELKNMYPDDLFFFILGGDSLLSFEKWREPREILGLAHVVATGRDNLAKQVILDKINYLQVTMNGCIHYLQVPNMDLSSSYIRKLRNLNKSITYYVPKEVESYIVDEKLYLDKID